MEVLFMEKLLFAYALVFAGLIILLIVTVRNRYIPLISCAIALVAVEGIPLIMWQGSLLVRQHLLEYFVVLFFVDVLLLLSIWPFVSGCRFNNQVQL